MREAMLAAAALALIAAPARAQLSGHNLKGDTGLLSATQPPPGFYVLATYFDYDADTLRGGDGNEIVLREGNLGANGYFVPLALYVTKAKLLGADYGVLVAPGWLNKRLEAPILELDEKGNTKFTDLYVQPVRLGWHRPRSDFLAGFGIFAPTGDYEFQGDSNSGLGMWSFELFAGATHYFDEKKTWHVSTTAFYETHTKKKDTEIEVGDILTLEGGLGRSFLGGGANAGIAYYAQWKVTADDLGLAPPPGFPLPGDPRLDKHRVFAAGPEATFPIATKEKLYAFVNFRYLWEFGARTTLEGSALYLTLTVPLPSVALR